MSTENSTQAGTTSTNPAGAADAGAPGAGKSEPTAIEVMTSGLDDSEKALLQEFRGSEKGKESKEEDAKAKAKAEAEAAEAAKAKAETEAAEKAKAEAEAGEGKGDGEGEGKTKEDDDGLEKVPEFDKTKLEPEAAKAWEALEKKAEGQSKAISRLTAKRREAEEKAKELEEERDALKSEVEGLRGSVAVTPTVDNPLANVFKESELSEREAKAQGVLAWCEDNEDGATVPKAAGSTETVEITAKQVREYRRQAEKDLKAVEARRKWLKDHQATAADAGKAYPDLRKGDDAKRREAMLKDVPGLAAYAHHDLLIGDALVGEKVRKGQLVAFPKGTTAAKTADKGKEKSEEVKGKAGTSAATDAGKEKDKKAEGANSVGAEELQRLQEAALNGDEDAAARLFRLKVERQ